ncbi:ABC transporter permease protein [Oceanobacillus picturae]|uniref:ABC transporter permease protein n=1 Tax=Oceanobacillus picturae TaxID=171693 RepID=W9AGE1_9BACI|nr:hypothetical protein [Oceanobacillus picturae]RIU93401.1 hypothetical protein D1864_08015 [Oceanobacillus picturae]GAQ17884.1 ABC transporter permease protein [Oceanobacillus picturae]CDO04784.1 hypothetical protein BN988_03351 [Oceanobacillus picturae]
MRKTFSVLSLISTLLGFTIIVSLTQDGKLFETLTFGTKGAWSIVMLNLYNFLGLLFACVAEKNKYRVILFIISISMLLVSLVATFVAVYGFQQP